MQMIQSANRRKNIPIQMILTEQGENKCSLGHCSTVTASTVFWTLPKSNKLAFKHDSNKARSKEELFRAL